MILLLEGKLMSTIFYLIYLFYNLYTNQIYNPLSINQSISHHIYREMTTWFQQPMLAYDHSKHSQMALEIFLNMKHKFHKSHIIHVCNPTKNGYVLYDISTAAIQSALKQAFKDNKSNTTIQIRQQSGKSINDIILESFISSSMSLLILGFVGTKGPKPRAKDLSSRVSQFVYQSKINLAIIKKEGMKTNNVLFCFDGSEVATAGLFKANEFCTAFGKTLLVLHCTTPELKTHSKHIKNQIKLLKQNNKQLKFDFICEQSLNLMEWIKQQEQNLQWIIITANGYRGEITKKRFVGTVATEILQNANVNVFLLKQ